MKRNLLRIAVAALAFIMLAGIAVPVIALTDAADDSDPHAEQEDQWLPGMTIPLNAFFPTDDHPDPPEDQRVESLSIYIAWDGGSQTWEMAFSEEGVIEECGPPPPPEDGEDEINFYDDELPGGRTIWFRGVRPGDVKLLFTIVNEDGIVGHAQQYAIRVFDDLTLALLEVQSIPSYE